VAEAPSSVRLASLSGGCSGLQESFNVTSPMQPSPAARGLPACRFANQDSRAYYTPRPVSMAPAEALLELSFVLVRAAVYDSILRPEQPWVPTHPARRALAKCWRGPT
jgi:hypothetical protein